MKFLIISSGLLEFLTYKLCRSISSLILSNGRLEPLGIYSLPPFLLTILKKFDRDCIEPKELSKSYSGRNTTSEPLKLNNLPEPTKSCAQLVNDASSASTNSNSLFVGNGSFSDSARAF